MGPKNIVISNIVFSKILQATRGILATETCDIGSSINRHATSGPPVKGNRLRLPSIVLWECRVGGQGRAQ